MLTISLRFRFRSRIVSVPYRFRFGSVSVTRIVSVPYRFRFRSCSVSPLLLRVWFLPVTLSRMVLPVVNVWFSPFIFVCVCSPSLVCVCVSSVSLVMEGWWFPNLPRGSSFPDVVSHRSYPIYLERSVPYRVPNKPNESLERCVLWKGVVPGHFRFRFWFLY